MPATTTASSEPSKPVPHGSPANLDRFIEERTAKMLAATAALKNPPPAPADAPKDPADKPTVAPMGTKLAQFMRDRNPFRKLFPPSRISSRTPSRFPPGAIKKHMIRHLTPHHSDEVSGDERVPSP